MTDISPEAVERLAVMLDHDDKRHQTTGSRAAETLRAQAAEIERLRTEVKATRGQIDELSQACSSALAVLNPSSGFIKKGDEMRQRHLERTRAKLRRAVPQVAAAFADQPPVGGP